MNQRDVRESLFGAGMWSGVIGGAFYGVEAIGRELQNALPILAFSVSTETVILIAAVSFGLIFLGKLLSQERSDNRADRE